MHLMKWAALAVLACALWSGDASAMMQVEEVCSTVSVGGVETVQCSVFVYDDGGGSNSGSGGSTETGGSGGGSGSGISYGEDPCKQSQLLCQLVTAKIEHKHLSCASQEYERQIAVRQSALSGKPVPELGRMVEVTLDGGKREWWTWICSGTRCNPAVGPGPTFSECRG